MGLPGSLLYGNAQILPSSLNDQGAPKHSRSPRSWTRKKIKAQSSLPEQFASCSPSMPAPASWRHSLDRMTSSHAFLFKRTQTCWDRAGSQSRQDPREVTPHAAGTTATQRLSHGGSASHHQVCKKPLINPAPGSWLYHSPVLKVAPDGKKGKSTSAPQRLLYFPSLQIGSLLTL